MVVLSISQKEVNYDNLLKSISSYIDQEKVVKSPFTLMIFGNWPSKRKIPHNYFNEIRPDTYNFIYLISNINEKHSKPKEIIKLQSLLPVIPDEKPFYNPFDANDFVGIHSIDLTPLFMDSSPVDLTFPTFSILAKEILQAVDNDLNFRNNEQIVFFLKAYLAELFTIQQYDMLNLNEIIISFSLNSKPQAHDKSLVEAIKVQFNFYLNRASALIEGQQVSNDDDTRVHRINLYRDQDNAIQVHRC